MAKRKATTAQPIIDDNPVQRLELAKAEQTGGIVSRWVAGLREFFDGAREMEQRANDVLQQVEAIDYIDTPEQDLTLQTLIVRANDGLKEAEDYWSITSTLSKLHKATVAGRKRTTDPLDRAKAMGNRLHGAFVDRQERERQAEQRRLQEQAEKEAREQAEAEARVLEEQALEQEASSPHLSARETVFVEGILFGRDPIFAAKQAGYKDPGKRGPALLNVEKIQTAIEAKRQARRLQDQADAVKRAPVPAEVPTVQRQTQHLAGTGDRVTWKGVVDDEAAFIAAMLAGDIEAPARVLQINRVELNKLAKDMREQMNVWPGVHAEKSTSLV